MGSGTISADSGTGGAAAGDEIIVGWLAAGGTTTDGATWGAIGTTSVGSTGATGWEERAVWLGVTCAVKESTGETFSGTGGAFGNGAACRKAYSFERLGVIGGGVFAGS